ncbi:hypothetical protein M758_1G061700 [Ceratodon purpureus]|nr:hypothetical protein M758_1G061700 [Ceratodon purpureus]
MGNNLFLLLHEFSLLSSLFRISLLHSALLSFDSNSRSATLGYSRIESLCGLG